MSQRLLLYWLTESGCDFGTQIDAERLDPNIREKVLALTANDTGSGQTLALRLPFFDRRESRRRSEVLRSLHFVREGDAIRALPPTEASALREYAANMVATDPAWIKAAHGGRREYFPTWQNVSIRLQQALRRWIPDLYFGGFDRYTDREAAYPLLVYMASRICRGRPRTEFTYDLADPEIFERATHMVGRALQDVLRGIEEKLHAVGRHELARRYSPIWHEDVLRSVQKKPRPFIALLGDEAVLINAVIGLGTARRMEAVKPFARAALTTLRSVCGEDMRILATRILDETQNVLAKKQEAADFRQPPRVCLS